jgi:hypothetical protein
MHALHYMCNRPMHSFVLRRSSKSTSASTAQPATHTAASGGACAAGSLPEAPTSLPRRALQAGAAAAAAGSSSNLRRFMTGGTYTHARLGGLGWDLLIHSTVKKAEQLSPQYTFSSNRMTMGAAEANPCAFHQATAAQRHTTKQDRIP